MRVSIRPPGDIATRVGVLAREVAALTQAANELPSRIGELERALGAATPSFASSASDLRAAGDAARNSVQPLREVGQSVTAAIEQINGAAQRLQGAETGAQTLAQGLTTAAQRFDGLDRELGKVVDTADGTACRISPAKSANSSLVQTRTWQKPRRSFTVQSLSLRMCWTITADRRGPREVVMRHPRHAADEEGEGYFASVSDLMVGILFVFLLMLTVFALNYRQAEQEQLVQLQTFTSERSRAADSSKPETERQTAEAERSVRKPTGNGVEAETQKQRNEVLRGQLTEALRLLEQDLQLREQARQSLLLTLGQQLHDRGVLVEVDERSGVLHLSGDLLFATGSAALSADALRTVRVLADVSTGHPAVLCGGSDGCTCPAGAVPVLETVLIEGHTDRRPIPVGARYRDNDQLATERALAVFAEMRKDQPNWTHLESATGYNCSVRRVMGIGGRCLMR